MTYNVFGGTLNLALSVHHVLLSFDVYRFLCWLSMFPHKMSALCLISLLDNLRNVLSTS